MKKQFTTALFTILFAGLFIMSCAMPPTDPLRPSFDPANLNPKVSSGQYQEKVDTFLVIIDASSSMKKPYQPPHKLTLAKQFLYDMYMAIPDIKLKGAQRSFGHSYKVSLSSTILNVGMRAFASPAFIGGLEFVRYAGGISPMESAIEAGTWDLLDAPGKIATIVVSDWGNMGNAPVGAARRMKEQYGEKLCIYTVMIGDHKGGEKLAEEVAQTGKCGFSINANSIGNREDMADFVEKVFLSKSMDTDGDGVYDSVDRCPNTPKPATVDSRGCPLDTDGDSVYDYLDQCPHTPEGVKVTQRGCPLDTDRDGVNDTVDQCPKSPAGANVSSSGCWTYGEVLFATDTAIIESGSDPTLEEIINVLHKNPSMDLVIEGHTDNQGPADYNMKLSQRRSNAVKDYFVDKGINSDRLSHAGYGDTKPRANNNTPEGRAMNRRVIFTPRF